MNICRYVRTVGLNPLTMLMLSLVFATSLHAASLPSHYPETFSWVGEVQNLQLSKQIIVVEDRKMSTGTVISVHRLRTSRTGSLADLSEGMIVGCQFGQTGQLMSIWELPDSYSEKSGTRLAR